jgi:hypothetical protein
MSHIRTIVSGIAGVVVMTLFSGLVSLFSRYDFTEHNVLAKLLNRLKLNKRTSYILGWKGHLLAGIGYSYLNKLLVEKKIIKPKVMPASGVGLLEGLIGIGIWNTVFKLHPKPPKINLNKYFYHLIFAHVVYAIVSVLSMRKTLKT